MTDTQMDPTPTDPNAITDVRTGSMGEASMGVGAAVLGILGLIGLAPRALDSIACIAVGVGLLAASRAISRAVPAPTADSARHPRQAIPSSLAMTSLAGVAGVVLGILALIGIGALAMLSAAAIVLGAGLIMAGGARARIEALWYARTAGDTRIMEDVAYAASGSDVLVGIGAVVLGILALGGFAPITLTLIAMLSLGAAILLGGSTITARAVGHID
ncbi:MAG TPA: hypothetical protein VFW98_08570 [Gemmatimonadaceae bacterium]|nr:hypothetical protein [Gemmatimonadaceae bacterium]